MSAINALPLRYIVIDTTEKTLLSATKQYLLILLYGPTHILQLLL
jgi:hypothetical protein